MECNTESAYVSEEVMKAYLPKHEGPLAITVEIPEDKEYFETADIIKLAEDIFDFVSKRKTAKTGQPGVPSDNYQTIKRYIQRELKGKAESHTGKASLIYSHDVVSGFLHDWKQQLHFLDIGIAQNEKRHGSISETVSSLEEKLKKPLKVKEREELEEKLKTAKNKKAELLEKLQRAKGKKQQILGGDKDHKEYLEQTTQFLDGSKNSNDTFLRLEDYKKQILFQFLFESLIELDEKLLVRDIKLLPSAEDGTAASDEQKRAVLRIKDLHNYYKGKIDLVKFLEDLIKVATVPQKPTYTTFKEK